MVVSGVKVVVSGVTVANRTTAVPCVRASVVAQGLAGERHHQAQSQLPAPHATAHDGAARGALVLQVHARGHTPRTSGREEHGQERERTHHRSAHTQDA